MCGPEENLAQGGRFPFWFERFIKLFNNNFFENNFTKHSNQNGKRPPWAKSSLGPHIHTPRIPKKVTGNPAKKSGRPIVHLHMHCFYTFIIQII